MPLRGDEPVAMVMIETPDGEPERSLTDVDPRPLDPFGENHDLRLWLALHLPHVDTALSCDDDDGTPNGLILAATGSRADVPYVPNGAGRWPVTQWGKRRLWDEFENAWRSWQRNRQPDRTRLGITARPDRQWVWLDHPDQPVSTLG
jgi:hypothetical protein